MKTLVFQVDIGAGSLENAINKVKTNPVMDNARKYMMPSVRKWASKNNYNYKLIENVTPFDNELVNSVYQWPFAWERAFHIDTEGYDQIIYLDNDIFIHPNTPSFPIIEHVAVTEDGNANYNARYKERYNVTDPRFNYINVGVMAFSAAGGKDLKEYLFNTAEKGEFQDSLGSPIQLFVNHYAKENMDKTVWLDPMWNWAPHLRGRSSLGYFTHFFGGSKKLATHPGFVKVMEECQ